METVQTQDLGNLRSRDQKQTGIREGPNHSIFPTSGLSKGLVSLFLHFEHSPLFFWRFYQYRLKRNTKLNVMDLSAVDRDYYFEIGGTEDVSQLKHRRNIDSVQRMAQQVRSAPSTTTNSRQPQPKRRRISAVQATRPQEILDLDEQDAPVDDNHNRRNHNVRQPVDDVLNPQQQNSSQSVDLSGQFPFDIGNLPDLDLTNGNLEELPPKTEHKSGYVPLTDVLERLQGKMTIFERDLLDKKNIEMQEITMTKMKAVTQAVEKQFLESPQLIGSIPNVPDQKASAFLCWFNYHKNEIMEDGHVRGDVNLVLTLLASLKAENNEWCEFLDRWILRRILHDDEFGAVWKAVKNELQIPSDPVVHYDESKSDVLPGARPAIPQAAQSDKEEADD